MRHTSSENPNQHAVQSTWQESTCRLPAMLAGLRFPVGLSLLHQGGPQALLPGCHSPGATALAASIRRKGLPGSSAQAREPAAGPCPGMPWPLLLALAASLLLPRGGHRLMPAVAAEPRAVPESAFVAVGFVRGHGSIGWRWLLSVVCRFRSVACRRAGIPGTRTAGRGVQHSAERGSACREAVARIP